MTAATWKAGIKIVFSIKNILLSQFALRYCLERIAGSAVYAVILFESK